MGFRPSPPHTQVVCRPYMTEFSWPDLVTITGSFAFQNNAGALSISLPLLNSTSSWVSVSPLAIHIYAESTIQSVNAHIHLIPGS